MYFGVMPFVHGSYNCPVCRYNLSPYENEDDQDIFDDTLLDEVENYPQRILQDLVLQRS